MKLQRLVILNVIIIVLIVVGGFVGYYLYNQSTLYLKTDDAKVSGKEIVVASPVAGKIISWKGTTGTTFHLGDTVGQVQVLSGKDAQTVDVPMPQDGTIVQDSEVTNEFVGAGTPLADAFNMNDLYVTANIKETQIQNVKIGDSVDIYADAFRGTSITGTVSQIGLATASTFSLMPSTSTNANFTKVTQVVPVKITLQSKPGGLVPGMSVTIRIHK